MSGSSIVVGLEDVIEASVVEEEVMPLCRPLLKLEFVGGSDMRRVVGSGPVSVKVKAAGVNATVAVFCSLVVSMLRTVTFSGCIMPGGTTLTSAKLHSYVG